MSGAIGFGAGLLPTFALAAAALARYNFPPARRASLKPIAIACFRLVTFFPERPERSVPRFRSCIARSTLLWAFLPYFAIGPSGREVQGMCLVNAVRPAHQSLISSGIVVGI